MDAQIVASKPLKKRLWKDIIKAKTAHQIEVLELCEKIDKTPYLKQLYNKIHSGDPQNIEAQAARHYWKSLMGDDFRRNRHAGGINSLLNYGYMVLRAFSARAIMGAGFHPTLGIFHKNQSNAMRLVDDIMEIYRPLVDYAVFSLKEHDIFELTPIVKRFLNELLAIETTGKHGATSLSNAMAQMTRSLRDIYLGGGEALFIPPIPDEITLKTYIESNLKSHDIGDEQ